MAKITLACQFCTTLNAIDPSRYRDKPKCAKCERPFLLDRPYKIYEEHFDTSVLQSEIPVLVDFYADWCGPCVMMAPLVDTVAEELAGQVLVAKVNTDASPTLSERYQIKGIPLFARFEDGKIAEQQAGAQSLDGLRKLATG